MGYNAVDNGYLRFDHLRIPRRNMLMKHSKVDVDGTYHPPPVAKASYGTMVFVRSDIVMSAALFLKKAVVIAIRYNIVRRQSNMQSNGLETQVLDYQHSQRSLFPLLATAYAFHFTGNIMRKMYYQFEKASRKGGDFSALPELHATSSGLKALCTWQTKEGIELARLCCGGHGYMHLSGLPHMGGNYAPQATYEGDNNVLCLQTARYLLKAVRAATAGEPLVGNVRYLEGAGASKCALHSSAAARDPQVLRSVLEHRVARLIRVAAEDMKQNNLSDDEGFQVYMIDWIKASKAHCAYVVFLNFVEGLADAAAALPPAATAALQRLLVLHGLTSIEDNSGDFMMDGFMNAEQMVVVKETIRQLLGEIRPDAIALVDSFGLDDFFLNSALGVKDGDVYRRLYEWVQTAPFNESHLPPGYEELLQKRLSKTPLKSPPWASKL